MLTGRMGGYDTTASGRWHCCSMETSLVKAVQGIILSALFVPGLLMPVAAQTMDQSLYRQAYDAVRANDQARFQQIRARLTHYPLVPYLD